MTKYWNRINKGDIRGRIMADNHYTRQSPGHPMWTRPGYNFCLYAEFKNGKALWCWWRPKWEDGRPGTKRKDNLRVIECTMFRREGKTPLASKLIKEAVAMLDTEIAIKDLHLDTAGKIDALITGVSSYATQKRRSKKAKPGHCYKMAGWKYLDKKTNKADIWLMLEWPKGSHPRKILN